MGSAGSVTGNVNGTLDYMFMTNYAYPSGFDASTCDTAQDTDTLGFGLEGELEINLGGSVNANFSSQGFTGTISVSASGNSTLNVKLPCLFCGDDCVSSFSVSLSGTISIQDTGSATRVMGEVSFSVAGQSFDASVDVTI